MNDDPEHIVFVSPAGEFRLIGPGFMYSLSFVERRSAASSAFTLPPELLITLGYRQHLGVVESYRRHDCWTEIEISSTIEDER